MASSARGFEFIPTVQEEGTRAHESGDRLAVSHSSIPHTHSRSILYHHVPCTKMEWQEAGVRERSGRKQCPEPKERSALWIWKARITGLS